MNILVTICARAGSKRLPGKNWRVLNGKPLFLWTVEQAIEWGKGVIVINSDALPILNSLEWGESENRQQRKILINKRPSELCGDDIPKIDVIRYSTIMAEKWLAEKRLLERFDVVVDLDVTNPMRTLDDIDNCINLLEDGWDTVVSVVHARRDPAFNMVVTPDCRVRLYDEWRRYTPGDVYDLNACIYVYRRNWLDLNINSPVGLNTRVYVMPPETAFDIDTETDFKIVEMLMKERYGLGDSKTKTPETYQMGLGSLVSREFQAG